MENEQVTNPFDTMGVKNAELGLRLVDTIKMPAHELFLPINVAKVQAISQFLNNHPDPDFVLSRVKNNKSPNMSNIDFLYGYAKLGTQYNELSNALQKIKSEMSFYE